MIEQTSGIVTRMLSAKERLLIIIVLLNVPLVISAILLPDRSSFNRRLVSLKASDDISEIRFLAKDRYCISTASFKDMDLSSHFSKHTWVMTLSFILSSCKCLKLIDEIEEKEINNVNNNSNNYIDN